MENNIIVDNTDNSIIICDDDGDDRIVKFKLDVDTNTVKVKELCDTHFRNNLNYNDMNLLILELIKLRDQLVLDEEKLGVVDPLKDFSSDFIKTLDYANKTDINLFNPRSEGRIVMNTTQAQQVVLPISEERKKMAIKQQENIDLLLNFTGKVKNG